MKARRKKSSNAKFAGQSSKRNHRKKSKQNQVDYQQLEPKNLLAVDVGVQFDASVLDVNTTEEQPAIAGDVGIDHIVELINGSYRVYDRTGGTVLEESTFLEFWTNTGATFDPAAQFADPRLVFDATSNRWFATTFEPADSGAFVDGEFYLAISVSADPTDGWRSVQFDASPGPLTIERASGLSVDGNAVYVTTSIQDVFNPPGSQAIFAFPKNDLLGAFPSIANVHRFEVLNQAVFGEQIQIGRENGNVDGRASGLAAFSAGGNTLSKVDLVGNLSGSGNVTLSRVDITVPTYLPGPEGRQPGGARELTSTSPLFTSGTYSANGYIWAVHAIQGSSGNSAVRWYQIDEVTNQLANTGTFDNPDVDYLAPSIAVNQFGTGVSIGFTATGPSLAPSSFTAHGFVNYATSSGTPDVEFSFPIQEIEEGAVAYERIDPATNENAWTIYSSTVVDPLDQFGFWNFNQVANSADTWRIHVSEAGIFDISPTISADATDNVIVLRQSDQNDNWIEVIVDGSLANVYEMTAIDELTVLAGGGDDLIVIDQTFGEIFAEELIEIRGGDGTDTIRYFDSNDHDFNLNGNGTGVIDNTIQIFEMEVVIGGDGDDNFTVQTSATDWVIQGDDGNDFIFVLPSATGMLTLEGQGGDDTYRIPLVNVPNIEITDSVDDEFDRVTGYGGDEGNVITIDGNLVTVDGIDLSRLTTYVGIESTSVDATGGNDEFRILSTLGSISVLGGDGNDTFFVSSDAPTNEGNTDGIVGNLAIDGGAGVSRLVVSNFSGSASDVVVRDGLITGLTVNPISYTGEFSTVAGQAGITLIGSSSTAQNRFDVRTLNANDSLEILGGAGNDIFTVRRLVDGRVFLDGQEGTDTYRTSAAGHGRTVNYNDSGIGDLDRIALSLTDDVDDFLISNEQINLIGEFFLWDQNIEKVIVDTRSGNDSVRIGNSDSQFVTVNLGLGNDEVILQNSNGIDGIRLSGGTGNDRFDFRGGQFATFVNAFGEAGNDEFIISSSSFSRARVDGGEGSDDVDITFSRRAGRRIDATDSGAGGNDTLVVRGTEFIDRVDMLATAVIRGGEPVIYSSNTEELTLDTGGNFDAVNVFGLSVASTNIVTRGGSDIVNIVRTATVDPGTVNLTVDLGNGNDTTNVEAIAANTNVLVFGQSGSDFVNVGSTLAQDSGNLNRINGNLRVNGGLGQDTVYINDNGATANYAYFLSGSVLTNLARDASATRTLFSAVRFDEVERVRFDASQGDNFVSLAESTTTEFIVDGNASADFLFVNGDIENRELTAGSQSGRYRFFDGSRDVTFVGFSGFIGGRNT